MKQKDFYYSKSNPRGPYQAHRVVPRDDTPETYIEGFSTQKNIDKWAARSTANSYPVGFPGLGKSKQRE
jgi:hypothetical protein